MSLDLVVIGAGPSGLSVAAAAQKAGLEVLTLDRGGIAASIQRYPTDLVYFSTRERLEIAGVPFAIPEVKPTRRQALVYYREVARAHGLELNLFEAVESIRPLAEGGFEVRSRKDGGERSYRSRAVALAVGFFDTPRELGVPGEQSGWVRQRYLEPYEHYGQAVVVVGGGNSGAEAALDLCRNGARVTLVHRGAELKPTVKYWLKPDVENRIAEQALEARWNTRVLAFQPPEEGRQGGVEVEGPGGRERLKADAVYLLIGYRPDLSLLAGTGVAIDPETLVPEHDEASCETNVPGFYIAGTLLAGKATNRLFIENTRDHGERIVSHLLSRRARATVP